MRELAFTATQERDTDRLGRALAETLPDGTVVALCGPLGAGKTRLVQAFAEARGVPREQVTSPTFVLLQHYGGERPIHHFDVYRIADEDEFVQLGPEEYFDSNGVTFVEWADRFLSLMPEEYLLIRIEVQAHDVRRFDLVAVGPAMGEVVERMEKALHGTDTEPRV